jgi:hypothetical protein
MPTLKSVLRWMGPIAICGVLVAAVLSSEPVSAAAGVSCKDHFNWRDGWMFPTRAHSGGEIPGQGWTVTGVHSVLEADWHYVLEGGYSEDWHDSCGA